MDADAFWELIERSGREAGTKDGRLAWLDGELSRRSAEEIVGFQTWSTAVANRGCTWDMYAAYWSVFGRGSTDGFEYFVYWLMGLGREAFERVAECPDEVIELPQVLHALKLRRTRLAARSSRIWSEEEYPEFELLAYVAFEPYEKVTGLDVEHLGDAVRARGVRDKFPIAEIDFDGEAWDFDDVAEATRRFPRITHYWGSRTPPVPSGDR
ncbi:DUF4240 domain-containing protein [Streptosporangium canum]|uniref:DUF4240 domain-containing protein n=1 Tax=Streptosporangium canum TaxID=324952 RepID=UPI0037AE5265